VAQVREDEREDEVVHEVEYLRRGLWGGRLRLRFLVVGLLLLLLPPCLWGRSSVPVGGNDDLAFVGHCQDAKRICGRSSSCGWG
jgi:hypothetical protein